jgi:superfamily I DNA/RNA helicase
MKINKTQLGKIINECRKHQLRLEEAAMDMKCFMPLEPESFNALSKDQIRVIDQFLFSFEKLQDAIGKKLFKSILLVLGEEIEDVPFIDMLNRLEKVNLFDDAEGWFELRQIRNELSHEYEDDINESCAIINKIYEQTGRLSGYFIRIDNYYREKIEEVQCPKL